MGYAEKIARFVADTSYDGLPADAIVQAKNSLLDILGCALAGARVRASRAALAVTADEAGAGAATVLTTGRKAALSQAAFANAILASVLDLDDGNYWSFAHAGAGVVPAALATTEVRGGTGRDLLTAIVVGYELTNYAGAILNAHHRERFYGTGSAVSYGAAGAVARLLGADAATAGHALGIARAHLPVSPILEFAQAGPMPKESIGWGTLTGTLAALLAEKGFTGPANDFSEPLHVENSDLSPLDDLGSKFTIVDTYRKYYPACLWTHAAAQATLEMRRRFGATADDVEEVVVRTNHRGITLNDAAPVSIEAAQYSLPYTLGVALVDGDLWVDQMHEDRLTDPRVLATAKRIRLELDPRIDAMFPRRRAARTELRLKDGRRDEIEVLTIKGSPEAPMSVEDVDAKFLRLASPVIGAPAAEAVRALARELEGHANLAPLHENLSAAMVAAR